MLAAVRESPVRSLLLLRHWLVSTRAWRAGQGGCASHHQVANGNAVAVMMSIVACSRWPSLLKWGLVKTRSGEGPPNRKIRRTLRRARCSVGATESISHVGDRAGVVLGMPVAGRPETGAPT